ncbi:MAG: putative transposase [Paraglaciecola sp.]|jgi:putative transposase
MPRANRYAMPRHIWHTTHRWHKKECLLKVKCERERGLYWLFAAKKRFNATILDYILTSDHIHLLVQDGVQ